MTSPDGKVHGANMGSIWGRQDPGGPHVGPMNIAIWDPLMAPWHGNTFRITGPFLLWPGETNASKAIQTLTAVLTRTKTSTRTITNHRNAINAFLKVPACYVRSESDRGQWLQALGLLRKSMTVKIYHCSWWLPCCHQTASQSWKFLLNNTDLTWKFQHYLYCPIWHRLPFIEPSKQTTHDWAKVDEICYKYFFQ